MGTICGLWEGQPYLTKVLVFTVEIDMHLETKEGDDESWLPDSHLNILFFPPRNSNSKEDERFIQNQPVLPSSMLPSSMLPTKTMLPT